MGFTEGCFVFTMYAFCGVNATIPAVRARSCTDTKF